MLIKKLAQSCCFSQTDICGGTVQEVMQTTKQYMRPGLDLTNAINISRAENSVAFKDFDSSGVLSFVIPGKETGTERSAFSSEIFALSCDTPLC